MVHPVLLVVTTLAIGIAATPSHSFASNPFEGNGAAVQEGHSLFNETCSHCHGPDAQTPISERNLRKLKLRYGDQMTEVFRSTVEKGRPEMGMPTWGGVIDEATIWKIYTYLETVQADQ